MRPIRHAGVLAATNRGVRLDCDNAATCTISVLRPNLFRVRFARGAVRAPNTWMVPAQGAADVSWEGCALAPGAPTLMAGEA
jgi:hypothetical protein